MVEKEKKDTYDRGGEAQSNKQVAELLTSILTDVKNQVSRDTTTAPSKALDEFERLTGALVLSLIVAAVSPSSGHGGISVTISGANFPAGPGPPRGFTVTFGGNGATVVSVSSREIVATTPGVGAAGQVDVVVSTATESATLLNGFTYQ